MVLLLNSTVIELKQVDLKSLLLDYSCFEKVNEFNQKPKQIINTNKHLLFLHQREMAIVKRTDPAIRYLGTDDATTCHFVVLDCPEVDLIGAAHLDGCGTELFVQKYVEFVRKCINNLLQQKKKEIEVDVYIVGGFLDIRQTSMNLSAEILGVMADKIEDFHFRLKLCCMLDLNNHIINRINFPINYGAIYHIQTQSIFPADFDNNSKEPVHILRSTRFCCPETIYNVYDTEKYVLQLTMFDYNGLRNRAFFLKILQLDDNSLRQFSTSPEQEKPDFSQNSRKTYQLMYDHPNPKKSLYDSKDGIKFTCSPLTGEWIRMI